jgi:RNA polymerase primary sigma factor
MNDRTLYFRYLDDIAKYPLISREEENLLLERIAKGGPKGKRALDRLVTANLKFVINIANLYKGQGLDVTELINEGNLGLIEAARRFDRSKNIKFISYAVWWVRQNIVRAINEKARIVRISAEKELMLRRFKRKGGGRLKQVVGGTYFTDPDALEGCSKYNAREIENILPMGQRALSLDAPLGEDGDTSLMETLSDNSSVLADKKLELADRRYQFRQILHELTPTEREVISLYYGLNSGSAINLREISKLLGLSKERTRQIKEDALFKLRDYDELHELLAAA